MSMFKKLTSFLFEETDAEVLAEDELEEVSLKEKKVSKDMRDDLHETTIQKTENEVIEKPTIVVEEKKEVKKFVSIDIQDEPSKEVEKEDTTKRTTYTSSKEESREYEYAPVISPIFGAKEEEVVTKKRSKTSPITIPQPKKKKNPLGTIISPYFGVGELEAFEAEAQKEIQEEEEIRRAEKEEAHEEAVATTSETSQRMEEELSSVSLEELLSIDSNEVDGDDLMQISLFGESTPIHEAETSEEINDNEEE